MVTTEVIFSMCQGYAQNQCRKRTNDLSIPHCILKHLLLIETSLQEYELPEKKEKKNMVTLKHNRIEHLKSSD